jgi:hypothetical protein
VSAGIHFDFIERAGQLSFRLTSPNGEIYVNANIGNNSNNGDQQNPLLTLDEAAKRVNNAKGGGSITIYLSKGVYGMQKTADFNPINWKLTKNKRLNNTCRSIAERFKVESLRYASSNFSNAVFC